MSTETEAERVAPVRRRQVFWQEDCVMKVVTAVDSFKGSLSSLEAGEAVREGILAVYPDAEVLVRPLADGGEGTAQALTLGMGGKMQSVRVTGPLGDVADASYGILRDGKTAVVEMSAAAGITMVPEKKRNPMHTTTYGVGEILRDAIKKGCREFVVGIGGSATNDGGIGMLQALGYGFLDENGQQVPFGAEGLRRLKSITDDGVLPELSECHFRVACDVTNPLCGKSGCSAVFGPQKGADPEMICQMDRWLSAYAQMSCNINPAADETCPGTGAAGGLGFAFLTFTKAALESGVRIVLEETHLAEYIRDADVVVTGEGRLDGQTVMGKAPIGVARLAKKYGKTVIAFSGSVTPDAKACNEHGIDAYFPILRSVVTLPEAMDARNAKQNMADTAQQVFRLYRAAGGPI